MRAWRSMVVASFVAFASASVLAEIPPMPATPPGHIKIVAAGAPVHSANGLAIDRDGNLVFASMLGSELVVMDGSSGAVLRRIPTLPQPDDLVFGPDGSLYYTSMVSGYVVRLSPDGRMTMQYVAPGANAITFSPEGRLFVALDFVGDGLYELDPNLEAPPRAIVRYAPGAYPLGFLNGFDFGPDGRLYGPLWLLGMVVSIDVNASRCSESLSPWSDCDITPVVVGLDTPPTAVKFDAAGRLHVTCEGGDVLRLEATGVKRIARLHAGLDNLVFDARQRLWVSNYFEGSLARVIDDNITYISPGGMVLPGGVAVVAGTDGTEHVVVADTFSLREFSVTTGAQLRVDRAVPAFSALAFPFSVSVDGPNLLLASVFSSAVQVWDRGRRTVIESRTLADYPVNAVRWRGEIAVATLNTDFTRGKVIGLDTGETILGDSSDVAYPVGLAASGDSLFVSDWGTGLVWMIDWSTGAPIRSKLGGGFSNPEGIALDNAGGLLVIEAGAGRLRRIDLASGVVTTVADGLVFNLSGFPAPHGALNDVTVSSTGAIFVTGDRFLYRIEPRK